MSMKGKVFLVGAGPGDPDLLTIKALRALQEADVIVYDRLVTADILALGAKGAARICVGKQPNNHPVPQDEINALLVRLALGGRTVARLKGGDPYIFGRGSEEALALVEHGIDFEVVPGITAAQGCAAAAGVPLTHRGLASGVRFITGHCREDRALDYDWAGLADLQTTLVVYMGAANAAQIAGRLTGNGLPGDTPVLIVNNGTTARERRTLTRLDHLAEALERGDYEGPVLFIVGQVAALAGRLGNLDAQSSEDSPALSA